MKTKISFSSELMDNYKQAEILAPDKEFKALQDVNGNSLFFSIGTDNVFYLIKESPGHLTGWEKINLSNVLSQFHDGKTIVAKTFSLCEKKNKTIDIALAITVDNNDFLYLASDIENTEASWNKDLKWLIMPFDDKNHTVSSINITNIYITETKSKEYIVVDILKDPKNLNKFIFRYYIDPNKKITGRIWNANDLAINLNDDNISSVLGKKSKQLVEGIYTLGNINGKKELIYSPLYNYFNPSIPPNPSRLVVPNSASALAVLLSPDGITDLFVACDNALYYYPANKQDDNAQGIKVVENEIFEDVKNLFVYTAGSKVIVWGLNRAEEIFYLTCDKSGILDKAAWSYPLPILKNVVQIAGYSNSMDVSNTFFAHTGQGKLKKGTQSIETTNWTYQDILLPPLNMDSKSLKFKSYTTRIHVADENNNPISNYKLKISTSSRKQVYINNLYYILDTDPIEILTDSLGGVTIVEEVNNLSSSCYKVSDENGSKIDIDPMKKTIDKIISLNSVEKLEKATINYGNGMSKPLISNDCNLDSKKAVVDSINQLSTILASLPKDGSNKEYVNINSSAFKLVPKENVCYLGSNPTYTEINEVNSLANEVKLGGFEVASSFYDFSNSIEVLAGDVLSFMQNTFKKVFDAFVVEIGNAWHFLVKVGEKIYRFAITCTEVLVNAFEIVFNSIKTTLEQLFDYLKFLFQWDDFIRTKDVFKKMLKLYLDHSVDSLDSLKLDFNKLITAAKNNIDDWADIKHDEWKRIDNSDKNLSFINSITPFQEILTAPAMFFYHHFIDNIFAIKSRALDTIPDPNKTENLIGEIINALESQGDIFIDTVTRIKREIIMNNGVTSLSLGDILKKLSAILLDALLNTSENIIDLLIDIFIILAKWAISAMDAEITIPVISDILEDAFGIKLSFSFLDIICMIGAIPATLFYKLAEGEAPFSNNDGFSSKILKASTVYDLQKAFPTNNALSSVPNDLTVKDKVQNEYIPVQLPPQAQKAIFIVTKVISGIAAMLSTALIVLEEQTEEPDGEFSTATGICGAVSAGSCFLTSLFAQPYPIENVIMSKLSSVCGGLTLLGKIAFKVAPSALVKAKKIENPSEIKALGNKLSIAGSFYDAVFGILALIPQCYHFYELSKKPKCKDRTLAIIDTTSNVSNCLSKQATLAMKLDKDPESKAIIAAIMGVLTFIYGGLQISQSIIEAANN